MPHIDNMVKGKITNFSKYIYKYFDNETYARSLVEKGNVMIGTAIGYRNIEGIRGDRFDSSVTPNFIIEDREKFAKDHPDAHAFLQPYPFIATAKKIYVTDTSFFMPDNYLFCTSTELSKKVADHFEAVACVKIKIIHRFFQRIARELTYKEYFEGSDNIFGEVIYYDPPYDWERHSFPFPNLPYFLKRSDIFSIEKEFRMMWQASKKT